MNSGASSPADDDLQTRAERTWGATLAAAAVDLDDPAMFAATIRVPPGTVLGEDDVATVAAATGPSPVDVEAPTVPEGRTAATGAIGALGADVGQAFLPGEELGAGGMGVVRLARQPALDREVALKTLRAGDGTAQDLHEQAFVDEAWITAALDHPGVVPVYALGRDGEGQLALAMKRVVGAPWSDLLRQEPAAGGPAALRRHLDVFAKVVDAVAFAHDREVLHRDLKPQNVMVGDYGQVYVVDWGLALRLDRPRPAASGDGMVAPCGTPAYMAPEMADGAGALSPATDVYLLGAILHELLTGRPPHRADSLLAVIVAAARNDVLPLRLDRDAPRGLVELTERCLATDPAARFVDAAALRAALERFLSGEAARDEAVALHAEAAARVAALDAAPPEAVDEAYGPLLEVDALVQAALVRWPECPAANALRRDVHTRLAETAVRAGDLALAASFVERVREDGGDVAALQAELDRQRRERDPALLVALDQGRRRALEAAAAGTFSALLVTVFVGVLMRIPGFPFAHWDDDGHPAWTVTLAICVASLPIQGGLLACVQALRPGRRRVYLGTQALVAAMFALSAVGVVWGWVATRAWGDAYWAAIFLLPMVLYRGVLASLRSEQVRALFPREA